MKLIQYIFTIICLSASSLSVSQPTENELMCENKIKAINDEYTQHQEELNSQFEERMNSLKKDYSQAVHSRKCLYERDKQMFQNNKIRLDNLKCEMEQDMASLASNFEKKELLLLTNHTSNEEELAKIFEDKKYTLKTQCKHLYGVAEVPEE